MGKFQTPAKLAARADGLRRNRRKNSGRIKVGMSTCGLASGAGAVYEALCKAADHETAIEVKRTGCLGLCFCEPLVSVETSERSVVFGNVSVSQASEVVSAARTGDIPTGLTEQDGSLKGQERRALRNCGVIDPEDIDDYIECGGYKTLAKVLHRFSADDVIGTLKDSGLRGRGGAGFPTGVKWEAAAESPGPHKYVVCNSDEGDPGAFMDRSILEGDPHSIIEAMIIAGYAVGAQTGYFYVRAEYPLAVRRMKTALRQAESYGLLGDDVLGSGFSFRIRLAQGAGAFVCGEETALLRSIEGGRGEPVKRPPYPVESGLWGRPTLINNVETFANIAPILERGAGWFRSLGTQHAPGTKVFALAGDIRRVGLVEVPLGTTLNKVINDIGGGSRSGLPIKSVLTGGPSGGCIPSDKFDSPIDYDTLLELGSMMGSGGMIVLDENASMVEIARYYLDFMCEESCGKCVPCRTGTRRMLALLDAVLDGDAKDTDIENLKELAETVKKSSLCGLGQTSPNPVLSTLRWYRHEYDELLESEKIFCIDMEHCTGCTLCARKCPVGAIDGEKGKPHTIRTEDCIKCGACEKVCKFDAVKLFLRNE